MIGLIINSRNYMKFSDNKYNNNYNYSFNYNNKFHFNFISLNFGQI